MAELDTNFVDAVLSANMNGKKRVRLTQIAENEYIVEDITEYEKVGSEYGQKEINTLNETVNGKVNKVEVIDDLDTVKAVTEDNVPVGCKAVTKFANDVNQSLGKVLATSGVYELNHTYGCAYYKNGNVVTVTVGFGNKTIPQSGITIGTLPASYRPSINVYARNSFDNQNGELFISSNGMVHLSSSKGTFDYGHFSISFAASSNFT